MSKVAILTDSTTFLPPDVIQEHGIHIVPLKLLWDGEAYRDGVDITPEQFYTRLATSPTLPTTSQPSVHDFLEAYEVLAADHDAIVAPLISSGISGTVESAVMAARQFQQIPVHVVDTRVTSAAQALVVLAAARAAAQGLPAETVAAQAQGIVDKIKTYFAVDTLKYLHKGGRIGGASRYLGTALSIKPILYFTEEGMIDALERVRTRRKALERLFTLVTESAGDAPAHLGIIHAQAEEQAVALRERLEQKLNCQEVITLELSPVLGVHVGPGTVGVAVYSRQAS